MATKGILSLWNQISANRELIVTNSIIRDDIIKMLQRIEQIYDPIFLSSLIELFHNHVADMNNPHQLNGLFNYRDLLEKAYRLWVNYNNAGTLEDFMNIIYNYILIAKYTNLFDNNLDQYRQIVISDDIHKYLEDEHNKSLLVHEELRRFIYLYLKNQTPIFTYTDVSNSEFLYTQFDKDFDTKVAYTFFNEAAYKFDFRTPLEKDGWYIKFHTTLLLNTHMFALYDPTSTLYTYLLVTYNSNNTISLSLYKNTSLIKSSSQIANTQSDMYLIYQNNTIFLLNDSTKEIVSLDLLITVGQFYPISIYVSKALWLSSDLQQLSIYSGLYSYLGSAIPNVPDPPETPDESLAYKEWTLSILYDVYLYTYNLIMASLPISTINTTGVDSLARNEDAQHAIQELNINPNASPPINLPSLPEPINYNNYTDVSYIFISMEYVQILLTYLMAQCSNDVLTHLPISKIDNIGVSQLTTDAEAANAMITPEPPDQPIISYTPTVPSLSSIMDTGTVSVTKFWVTNTINNAINQCLLNTIATLPLISTTSSGIFKLATDSEANIAIS